MLTKATVVGSGAMGTVIAQLLAGNRVNVALLARRRELADQIAQSRENPAHLPGVHLSDKVVPTTDARAALAGAELVFAAVPCQYLRQAWQPIARWVEPGTPICSVIKGIEISTLRRPSQIVASFNADCPAAVLSGPSIAAEIARYLPATVVIASQRPEVAARVQAALNTSTFRVYTNPDVVGVELAGAVKNVIALAAGILDGLRAGDNAKAALLTRGLAEISRLGVALGARPQTFIGLAGVGDLVTTCVSPLGRNRSAGEQLALGKSLDDVVRGSSSVIEGIPTTRAVLELARRHGVEMPITQAVYDVCFEGKPPLAAITDLMNRPPKSEDA
jgi:glycerol-3-phosphate dehydrogenase (NAD(P)+)